MKDIRKICIGPDYKNSMCYVVQQSVLGKTHVIHLIKQDEPTGTITIWIEKDDLIIRWKEFSAEMPIAIEYNINF